MHIRILGTAAAEGWPALFCNCDACREARKRGGKNLRTRSSILVDHTLKIDLPPDTLSHCHNYNLELHKLRYLLFTHAHEDHLSLAELHYLFTPFALSGETEGLMILGNRQVTGMIRREFEKDPRQPDVILSELAPRQEIDLGPYRITAIPAVHGTEQPLNYIIEKAGSRLLYTCDTGVYPDETWEFLRGRRVDLVISECTGGPMRLDYPSHMGFPNVQDFRRKAEDVGLADGDTRWALTHFSHGGGMLHEELCGLAEPEGFTVCRDGMEIDL